MKPAHRGTTGTADRILAGRATGTPPVYNVHPSKCPGSFGDAQNRHNQNILRTYPSSASLKYALPLLVCALSILLCSKVICQRQGGHDNVSTNLTYSKLISLRKGNISSWSIYQLLFCSLCPVSQARGHKIIYDDMIMCIIIYEKGFIAMITNSFAWYLQFIAMNITSYAW